MHYRNPRACDARVLVFYRNFKAAENPKCHVGLGVNALHTVRALRKHKICADAFGVWTAEHIRARLRENPGTSHALIEAPWVSTADTAALMNEFPNTHFIVRSHSNIGFLQVEAGAIRIIRELLVLQEQALNLTVAANSRRLATFLEQTYAARCLFLPNLYDLDRVTRKRDRLHDHRLLRIGSFGALRLLKNHTTAAAAAMMIARNRGADLEFWISSNREENGRGILDALRNMFAGVCWAKLVEQPWQDWADFRRTAAHMDLCLQLSATETFNIVTADAASEHVPSVVTPAIEWVPDYWKVDGDKVEDVARVGSCLLSSIDSAEDGRRALERFVEDATSIWLRYLEGAP